MEAIKRKIQPSDRTPELELSVANGDRAYSDAIPDVPIYRLSVKQYQQMAKQGILKDGDPVELLEGWLVHKMTKNPPHIYTSNLLRDVLQRLLHDGWFVNSQDPMTTQDSEPEPDLSVIRGYRRDYLTRKPGLGEIALVIEVADSTLRQDRGIKKRIYAQAGIPVYWLANLVDQCIEVYTEPTGPAPKPDYGAKRVYDKDDELNVVIDGQTIGRIEVQDLLP